MTRERGLLAGAASAFVVGVALMVPFEAVATRIAGVIALFVFIVLGVFAIASPAWLTENVTEQTSPGQNGWDADRDAGAA